MSRTFQAAAILTSISYTKDGGLRLGFTTQELHEDAKVIAGSYHNQFGHVLFKENAFTNDELPTENAEGKYKSKGAHYRAVLYAYWKKIGEPTDFETYYARHMEEKIDALKADLQTLDEEED
jgi:hypothetical protein